MRNKNAKLHTTNTTHHQPELLKGFSKTDYPTASDAIQQNFIKIENILSPIDPCIYIFTHDISMVQRRNPNKTDDYEIIKHKNKKDLFDKKMRR